MAKKVLFFILLVCNFFYSYGDEAGEISISVNPGGLIPFGENSGLFKIGGGANIAFNFDLASLPFVFFKTSLDYEYIPIITKEAVSVLSVSGGGGFVFSPFEWVSLKAFGTGGYYYGFMTDGSNSGGGNLILSYGGSLQFNISPAFSIDLQVDYSIRKFLVDGIKAFIGTTIRPKGFKSSQTAIDDLKILKTGKSGAGLDIESVKFNKIFPVLFKYYDNNPIGVVCIFNNESKPITNISISFFAEGYMTNPQKSSNIKKIEANSIADLDIYALFTEAVLNITEGTKVSTNLILNYTYKGKDYARKYVVSMDMYDRNAITWDDDEKAAAFVTAKDPAVLQYAKNVSGWIQKIRPTAIDKNFCTALAIHNSLNLYGITYQKDPKTPFIEFSKESSLIDFLQFPRQTLSYSSGDCDDLSILYSALFESLGIETAFITIPGHIFMAFTLRMEPGEAKYHFLKQQDLIFRNDKVWIPVEITMVQDSFLEAWAEGAKEWREYEIKDLAVLYPIHDAWNKYKPAGLPGNTEILMPDKDKIVKNTEAELAKFIEREIYPQVEELKARIASSDNSPKYLNRLGTLYARYGMNDRAKAELEKILKSGEYLPALVNLGNIYYLDRSMKKALMYYERAKEIKPDNPTVLLAIARTSHELENYGTVKEAYNLLAKIDPALANKYSYLELRDDNATRAAGVEDLKESVIWEEE